jgi:hypothetical protein
MKKLLSLVFLLLVGGAPVAKGVTWLEWFKEYPERNRGEFTTSTKIAAGVGLTVLFFYHIKAYRDRSRSRNQALSYFNDIINFDDQALQLRNDITHRSLHALETEDKAQRDCFKTVYTGAAIGLGAAVVTKVALTGLEKLYAMIKK